MLIYIVLWNIYPLLYLAIFSTDAEAVEQVLVNNPRYQTVVIITVFGILITLALLIYQRNPVYRSVCSGPGEREVSPRVILMLLVTSLPMIVVLNGWLEDLRGVGFDAVTSVVMTAGNEDLAQIGVIETCITFLVALAMACATSYRNFSAYKQLIAYLAWSVLLLHILNNVGHGNRAVLLLPAVAFLGASLGSRKKYSLLRGAILCVFLFLSIVLASIIAMVVGAVRTGITDRLSIDTISQGYSYMVSGQSLKDQAFIAATGLYIKLDAYQTGVILLESQDSESRRWSPIIASLLSPIPRFIYPDKPVPTSSNGEASGTPYRMAAEPFGDIELGTVVPVSPVAVAVWEVGYPLIGLWVIANVAYLVLINSFLLCKSILHRAIGFTMLSLPTAEFIFSPISSIVRDSLRNIMYLVLINVMILALIQIRGTFRLAAASYRDRQRVQVV
jgi:hypothetical protein